MFLCDSQFESVCVSMCVSMGVSMCVSMCGYESLSMYYTLSNLLSPILTL